MAIATTAEPRRAPVRAAIAATGLFACIAVAHSGAVAGDAARFFSSRAAAASAERRLAAGKPHDAEALAAVALRAAPLSPGALRTLALARQAQGRRREAAAAMALAAGLGWRDTPTQLWLIDAYLRQGDLAAALERADALARRGRYRDEMIDLFVAAARAGGGEAVAARLAARPPWRDAFVRRRGG